MFRVFCIALFLCSLVNVSVHASTSKSPDLEFRTWAFESCATNDITDSKVVYWNGTECEDLPIPEGTDNTLYAHKLDLLNEEPCFPEDISQVASDAGYIAVLTHEPERDDYSTARKVNAVWLANTGPIPVFITRSGDVWEEQPITVSLTQDKFGYATWQGICGFITATSIICFIYIGYLTVMILLDSHQKGRDMKSIGTICLVMHVFQCVFGILFFIDYLQVNHVYADALDSVFSFLAFIPFFFITVFLTYGQAIVLHEAHVISHQVFKGVTMLSVLLLAIAMIVGIVSALDSFEIEGDFIEFVDDNDTWIEGFLFISIALFFIFTRRMIVQALNSSSGSAGGFSDKSAKSQTSKTVSARDAKLERSTHNLFICGILIIVWNIWNLLSEACDDIYGVALCDFLFYCWKFGFLPWMCLFQVRSLDSRTSVKSGTMSKGTKAGKSAPNVASGSAV